MTIRSSKITFKHQVRFQRERCGRKRMTPTEPVLPGVSDVEGCIPRISRLMALAIRFDEVIRAGEIEDYAELARLGHVTRARLTQIMNLLNLAPDIQEQLLFLPSVGRGRDPVKEWQLRPIAANRCWKKQRTLYNRLSKPTREQPAPQI